LETPSSTRSRFHSHTHSLLRPRAHTRTRTIPRTRTPRARRRTQTHADARLRITRILTHTWPAHTPTPTPTHAYQPNPPYLPSRSANTITIACTRPQQDRIDHPPSLCWSTLTLQTPACTHKRAGKILDVLFLRHNADFCCSLGEEFSSWVRSPLSVPPSASGPCPALPVLLASLPTSTALASSSSYHYDYCHCLHCFIRPYLVVLLSPFGSPLSAYRILHISLVDQYLVATSLSLCIAR
jgi:hypothetical protein